MLHKPGDHVVIPHDAYGGTFRLYDKVLTAFQDHLFSDVEQNIQTEMRRMVEDSVKALSVEGVTATEATVKDGSYKVQRPFVLVTVDGKALSPAAQAFFDYATSSDAASIIAKAGAVAVAG